MIINIFGHRQKHSKHKNIVQTMYISIKLRKFKILKRKHEYVNNIEISKWVCTIFFYIKYTKYKKIFMEI